ncbi:molybdopterin synthase catalytic subunit; molybdo pterin converting factor subunit [Trichuris trichiura]|uniref:Molybdopterin synthase catalytic subunit molybdo pterin converting factor subunit n=1 Tax=Trichuris trichiura TaxID=36087 RepID=A0A077ZBY4_TRITR|nr:molybdopterin synthase catalytic subunit; molybdo pterin converting factor subunit [Trichuris trichiura]
MSTAESSLVVGLGGATCSGKSSIASWLLKFLTSCGIKTALLQQDHFYKEATRELYIAELDHWNFDSIEAVDFQQLVNQMKTIEKTDRPQVILVEGNMIFEYQPLDELFDQRFFFTVSYERCSTRRQRRTYEPPDVIGYLEQIAWPYYQSSYAKALSRADSFEWINGDECLDEIFLRVASSVIRLIDSNWIMLTKDKLNIQLVVDYVQDKFDGATFLFVGTVRQNIRPPEVVYLYYEAYERMAMKQLRDVCKQIRQLWPPIDKIVIAHRLGRPIGTISPYRRVSVGEMCIIVAISSPHRAEAISAVEYCVETIKKQVPIWKKLSFFAIYRCGAVRSKEAYNDGSAEWKANDFSTSNATRMRQARSE